MSIPKTDQFPDDPEDLSPARRRRAERGLVPEDLISVAEDIESLAHSTIPSFDFFLFSLLAGAIITASILADSPALLVLGALAAPPLTPFIGISLGTATGSLKFFSQRFIGSLVASGFIFLVGILGGYATFVLKTPGIQFLIYNARVSWAHMVLLIAGTVFSVISIKRQQQIPILPSVALAYELYVPLAIAGFGFGSGQPHLWPDGLVVFGIHLAVMAITGTIVFVLMGIKPLNFIGYTLGSVITILGIVLVIGLSSAGAVVGGKIAMPTLVPTATQTATPVPPTLTPTNTPIPPTPSPSPTVPTATATPQPTATSSVTPKPTPFFAEIAAPENDAVDFPGASIRSGPSHQSLWLTSLLNGVMIEILNPSPSYDEAGGSWLNVRFINADGNEQDGWIRENLILISTPQPDW